MYTAKNDAHHLLTNIVYRYVTSKTLLELVNGTLSNTKYIFYNRMCVRFNFM